MKYSRQREMIRNALAETKSHPSAEQLYLLLKERLPNLSLGTVYRNLNLLVKNKEAQKLSLQEGGERFDGNPREHGHAVCERCGTVFDFEMPELALFDQAVEERSGISITGRQYIVKGICKSCR